VITVRIPKETLRGFGADIHAMLHTLEALKKAGIPVVGSLGVMGVSKGSLLMNDRELTDEIVWTWDGEEDLS
jgi:hypothetical protein